MQLTDHFTHDAAPRIDDALSNEYPVIAAHGAQADELLMCEETLRQVFAEGTFQAGAILRKIRDQKLYHPSHKSFTEYLSIRWGWSYSHIHRIIDGAILFETVTTSPIGEVVRPTAESQLRPLVQLKDADKQRAAWKLAVETAGGRVPTAEQVKAAVLEIGPPAPPKARRAISTTCALTASHGVVGVDHNPPPASDAVFARDHTDGAGQEVGALTSAPTRVAVRDEEERPKDSDLLLGTQPSIRSGSESSASALPGNTGPSSDDDYKSESGLNGTPTAVEPQHETLKVASSEERSARDNELRGDEHGDRVVVENPAACETIDGNGEPVASNQLSTLAATVRKDGETEPDIANAPGASCPLSAGDEAQVDGSTAQPSARFDFADGTEVVSTIFSGEGEITTRLVQAVLVTVAHSLVMRSPSEVARRQQYAVMLAEVLDQATREKAGLTTRQVLSDIEYAVFTWKKRLDKNKPKKRTHK